MTQISLIDPSLKPKSEDCDFDLTEALSSVVSIKATVPENAFTVPSLGIERAGHGVVIRDSGLILTIGYLTIEAQTIWIIDGTGKAVPGHVTAYDQESGFALIQSLGTLNTIPLALGKSSDAKIGENVILAGSGGLDDSIKSYITEKKEFAGYWEYLINEAIFTAPPHPFWGGAGLISRHGELLGIASLFVQQSKSGDVTYDGNMIVPIDLLPPILDDLLKFGSINKTPRPWIGTIMSENYNSLKVAAVIPGSPSEKAGLKAGDKVRYVNGNLTNTLSLFLRQLWSTGDAGVDVNISVVRDHQIIELKVRSADRNSYLLKPNVH